MGPCAIKMKVAPEIAGFQGLFGGGDGRTLAIEDTAKP
jgi:hypothetical protein